jgi:hypothetical protein
MVHNLTRFFYRVETASLLKQTTGMICKSCLLLFVSSAYSNATSKGLIPRPAGGLYLRNAANVTVDIREHSGTSTLLPLRQHY